jgi:hypothetical protein
MNTDCKPHHDIAKCHEESDYIDNNQERQSNDHEQEYALSTARVFLIPDEEGKNTYGEDQTSSVLG